MLRAGQRAAHWFVDAEVAVGEDNTAMTITPSQATADREQREVAVPDETASYVLGLQEPLTVAELATRGRSGLCRSGSSGTRRQFRRWH